jgi:ABC-type Fe3+/spermidine/putrescine transport system ATPase subunit
VADFLGYSNIFPVAEKKAIDVGHAVVLAGSKTRLRASGGPNGAASDLHACIRPEDVDIAPWHGAPAAPPDACDNILAGEVTLASFMGSFMQYRVCSEGGEILEIVSRKIDTAIKLGDRVRLGIRPDRVHLLPQI